jgi:hypothetical protein
MTSIRPFEIGDLEQVAALHRHIFRPSIESEDGWLEAYRTYFAEVFLNAVCNGPVTSLVYERDGGVRGFLGVMPRQMRFKGRSALMAVCSQFVVDPAERGQAGLRMLKQCFEGPQDLTISDEAGDATRRIWKWCGGDTLMLHSLRWMVPLAPVQLALAVLAERKGWGWLPNAAKPVARLADAIIAKGAAVDTAAASPSGTRADLDEAGLLECLSDVAGTWALGPDYDAHTLAWVCHRISERSRFGATRKMIVRDEHQTAIGWFLYCLDGEQIADVVQVAARRGGMTAVLQHLFDDAREQRAIAVCGRLDRELMASLSETPSFFHRGSYWTLFHSSNRELREAVHGGCGFLSRLEGELCLRFH